MPVHRPNRFPARQRLLLVVLLVATALPAHAQTRTFRRFDAADGLVPAMVISLAQDRDGLIWVGTAGGVYRYDGHEFVRWAPSELQSWIRTITVSPQGTIVALDEEKFALWEIIDHGAKPVIGPDGEPLEAVLTAAFDPRGALWAARERDLLRRSPSNEWTSIPIEDIDGSGIRRVIADERAGGGLLVMTDDGVHATVDGTSFERVATAAAPVYAEGHADGSITTLTFNGEVIEVTADGTERRRSYGPGRGVATLRRNTTTWISFDRRVVAIDADSVAETLDEDDGLTGGGGPLLLDREGGLWLGNLDGLTYFPEPDTRVWTEVHGLPNRQTRFVAVRGDTTWVMTWTRTGYIARTRGGWSVGTTDDGSWGAVLEDAAGRLWVGTDHGLRRTSGRSTRRYGGEPVGLFDIAEDASTGTTWLGTDRGLLYVDASESVNRVPSTRLAGRDRHEAVLIDSSGRLWTASGDIVCVTAGTAAAAISHPDSRFLCDPAPIAHQVSGLVEMPSGSIWMTAHRGGVFRRTATGWEPLQGLSDIISPDISDVVESKSGGVWLPGPSGIIRVVEDLSIAAGWREVERVSTWSGVTSRPESVYEEDDGTLWVASVAGVARVPLSARRLPPRPPPVVLVDALADDEALSLGEPAVLGPSRNRLRLRFAAISYREPTRLRYQVRLLPAGEWESIGGLPEFRWVDLRPGRFRAEVRASLDNITWTETPAAYEFRVLPPWYRTPWFIALCALSAAGIIYVIHRARVRHLIDLERQRARIAMDLHDELGSGLGSIGILAGVLETQARDAAAPARPMAQQISATATELGSALSDIVWSLDPRTVRLEDVITRTVEHGNRLFPEGRAEFTADLPAIWPRTSLDSTMRRNLLLILLEALHNAARHAEARHVRLTASISDAAWRLSIEDDGAGIPRDARRPGGRGLESMKLRAHEIGAGLEWRPADGGGTMVVLTVPAPNAGKVRHWSAARRRIP